MGVIWAVFVAGVTALFVFELWLIFEWGDCAAKNDEYEALGRPADMDLCMGPEDTRGFAGWLAGIVPGLLEALAFAAELFNTDKTVLATALTMRNIGNRSNVGR